MIGAKPNVNANSGTTKGEDMNVPPSYLVDYLNYMNDAIWKVYKFLHDIDCIADIDPSKLPDGAIDDEGKMNPDILKTENGNTVVPLDAPPDDLLEIWELQGPCWLAIKAFRADKSSWPWQKERGLSDYQIYMKNMTIWVDHDNGMLKTRLRYMKQYPNYKWAGIYMCFSSHWKGRRPKFKLSLPSLPSLPLLPIIGAVFPSGGGKYAKLPKDVKMCLLPYWQRCFNRCWKTAVSCPVPTEGKRPDTLSGADINKNDDPITKWLLPIITDEYSDNHDLGYTNVWYDAVYKKLPSGQYEREFYKVKPTQLPSQPVALLNLLYVNVLSKTVDVDVVYTKENFMKRITENAARDVYNGPTGDILTDKQKLIDFVHHSPWKDEILNPTPTTSPTTPGSQRRQRHRSQQAKPIVKLSSSPIKAIPPF